MKVKLAKKFHYFPILKEFNLFIKLSKFKCENDNVFHSALYSLLPSTTSIIHFHSFASCASHSIQTLLNIIPYYFTYLISGHSARHQIFANSKLNECSPASSSQRPKNINFIKLLFVSSLSVSRLYC